MKWTREDLDLLVTMHQSTDIKVKDIAEKLKKTRGAVRSKIAYLGLPHRREKSPYEDVQEQVKTHRHLSLAEVKKLGFIKKRTAPIRWEPREDEIVSSWNGDTNGLVEELGGKRTRDAVMRRVVTLRKRDADHFNGSSVSV